jgi:hypothetical protein
VMRSWRDKLDMFVDFPLEWDLSEYERSHEQAASGPGPRYQLYAVVVRPPLFLSSSFFVSLKRWWLTFYRAEPLGRDGRGALHRTYEGRWRSLVPPPFCLSPINRIDQHVADPVQGGITTTRCVWPPMLPGCARRMPTSCATAESSPSTRLQHQQVRCIHRRMLTIYAFHVLCVFLNVPIFCQLSGAGGGCGVVVSSVVVACLRHKK